MVDLELKESDHNLKENDNETEENNEKPIKLEESESW